MMRFGLVGLAYVALAVSAAAAVPTFSTGVVAGVVGDALVTEASGLAASRGNPRVLWLHNDRGDGARVFAITESGALLGEFVLPGVLAEDFEDVACGPGPELGVSYLYIGDIGDNSALRTNIFIYRAPEPPVYPAFSNAPLGRALTNLATLRCVYPGSRRDAEALLVDPVTTSIFIATKDPSTEVYEIPYRAWFSTGVCTLRLVATLSVISRVTGGDISPDGALIVLRAKDKICAWERQPNESVPAALGRSPHLLPLRAEPQGEAVAFAADNSCYFTLSEGVSQPLYRYDRVDAVRAVFVLPPGAVWRWRPADHAIGDAWRHADFDDSSWYVGMAPLGSNYPFLATVVRPPALNAWTTLWFRTRFSGESVVLTAAYLRAMFDDGCALYLNGEEVMRVNLSSNALPDTLASSYYGVQGATWYTVPMPVSLFEGTNCVVAAEVHQAGGSAGFATVLFDAQCELQPFIPEPQRSALLCACLYLCAAFRRHVRKDGCNE